MKTVLFFSLAAFALVLTPFSKVYSQAQGIEILYKKTTSLAEAPTNAKTYFITKANETSSLYSLVDKNKAQRIDTVNSSLYFVKNSKFKGIYEDKVNDELYYSSSIFNKYFIVNEKGFTENQIIWTIDSSQDVKEILGFSCKKATTQFRGREYVAYYSDSLNYSVAPFKFKGLPGIVLKIESLDGVHTFEAESVKLLSGTIDISNPYLGEKVIYQTFKEYKQDYRRKVSQYVKKENARDSEGEIMINDYSIELTWE